MNVLGIDEILHQIQTDILAEVLQLALEVHLKGAFRWG
jgi:hypothetical protein